MVFSREVAKTALVSRFVCLHSHPVGQLTQHCPLYLPSYYYAAPRGYQLLQEVGSLLLCLECEAWWVHAVQEKVLWLRSYVSVVFCCHMLSAVICRLLSYVVCRHMSSIVVCVCCHVVCCHMLSVVVCCLCHTFSLSPEPHGQVNSAETAKLRWHMWPLLSLAPAGPSLPFTPQDQTWVKALKATEQLIHLKNSATEMRKQF